MILRWQFHANYYLKLHFPFFRVEWKIWSIDIDHKKTQMSTSFIVIQDD